MCACNTVMALGSLPGHSKGITRVQVGKIVSGTARNIVAGHAYVVLEVRGESTEINDYMAANVETTVKGLAAAYECTYKLTRMGEAVRRGGGRARQGRRPRRRRRDARHRHERQGR